MMNISMRKKIYGMAIGEFQLTGVCLNLDGDADGKL